MKKNVVALLLSVVLVSGSLGSVPVMAAETVKQQTGEVQDEAEEVVSEDEAAQPAGKIVGEEPKQQTEVAETIVETDTSETEAVDENDYLEAESAVESDVTEAETAEEVDPGETASNASDTAEPKELEESSVVEEENESELSAEETEISDKSDLNP